MSSIASSAMPFNNSATDGLTITGAVWNQAMQTIVTAVNDNSTQIQSIKNAQTTILVATGSSYPATPSSGQLFYRTDIPGLKIYNGTSWVDPEYTSTNATNMLIGGIQYPAATAATAGTIAARDGSGSLTVAGLTASSVISINGGATVATGQVLTNNGSYGGSAILPVANGGTGSSTQNFVDLSTAQTIGGAKTFTNGVILGNGTPSAGPDIHSDGTNVYVEAASGGTVYIRPNGLNSNNGMMTVGTGGAVQTRDSSGNVRNTLDDGNGVATLKSLWLSGALIMNVPPGSSQWSQPIYFKGTDASNVTRQWYMQADSLGNAWFGNNSGTNIFKITQAGAVTTPNNTLDDGSTGTAFFGNSTNGYMRIISDANYVWIQGTNGAQNAAKALKLTGYNAANVAVYTGNNTLDDGTGKAQLASVQFNSNQINSVGAVELALNYGNQTQNTHIYSPTIIEGALTVNGSGGSFANSKAANGYQKFPGGVIKQWGVLTLGPSASSVVTFPTAFPTACVAVVPGYPFWLNTGTPSASQVTIYNTTSTQYTAYWEAIGY